jgi:hypothetical protein
MVPSSGGGGGGFWYERFAMDDEEHMVMDQVSYYELMVYPSDLAQIIII